MSCKPPPQHVPGQQHSNSGGDRVAEAARPRHGERVGSGRSVPTRAPRLQHPLHLFSTLSFGFSSSSLPSSRPARLCLPNEPHFKLLVFIQVSPIASRKAATCFLISWSSSSPLCSFLVVFFFFGGGLHLFSSIIDRSHRYFLLYYLSVLFLLPPTLIF